MLSLPGARLALLTGLLAALSFVGSSARTVIGMLVDESSPAAVRGAAHLEIALGHLSREVLLDVTVLPRPLATGVIDGGHMAGVVAVAGCCTDQQTLELSATLPVLCLMLEGRCPPESRFLPAPNAPHTKVREGRPAGAVGCNESEESAVWSCQDPAVLRLWVKAVIDGKEPVGLRQCRVSSWSTSSFVSSSSSPFTFHPELLVSRYLRHSKFSGTQQPSPTHVQPAAQQRDRTAVVVEEEHGAESSLRRVRAEGRKVLSGQVLTIAMKHRPPYVALVKDGRTIVEASGILIEVLKSFATTFNFTYILKLPDDDQWGSQQNDGTWTGMVGEVYRREVEMALGPTSITEAREKAIDFTVPFDYEPWDILIPESITTVDLTAYLFPFAGQVWCGLAAATLVVGVLTWALARLWGDQGLLYPRKGSCLSYSLSQYILDIYGCLVSQANRQPQTGPVRILVGWWWVFCLVVVASYSSKLISSLTVRFTEPPVKSLQDLVESKKLLWTYLANSAMEEVFKFSAPNTLFGKVGQLHKDNPGLLVYSFEEGVAAVRSKKFAYFEDNSWLEFAVADDLALHGECRMTVVRDRFFSTRFGIILQSESPFRDVLSSEILQIIQSGLMDAWKKQFWPQSSCMIKSHAKQALRPLNLLDLFGTMILMMAGSGLAILSFVGELIFAHYQLSSSSI